ncbi:MAG: sigma 54-interacting transcriptional regulator, partial [Planctomycetes bacterium]|nr:sigma 54-interacting transcriptional regulator [Planctomycetota bacterium]
LHLEPLLNHVIDDAIEMTGAERGFLILVGKHEMEFRVARNFERQDVGAPEFAVSWSIATQVSSSGQPLLCVNAAEDARFGAQDSVLSLGLRSVMCVPFKVKSRVLGVIYVDNRLHKGVFSKTDFRILGILADHAAVALENARLYQEVVDQKRSLEDMNRRLEHQVEEQDSRLRAAWPDGPTRFDPANLDRIGHRGALVGGSAAMRELRALIRKVASSDLPVLITGDSGTGKELIAQAVHALSPRSARRMVAENCCAIPETLLESELFGYQKGAFTGANADREGLFVAASRGTLFLDEIGDLSPSLQTKLLRVLQEGEVRPIGGKAPIKIDVRLVCATNHDLARAIEENRFREDLYYRIKVVSLVAPPLRERKDDIPALVEHFLTLQAAEAGRERRQITKEALELLKAYNWPGNVRELENELKSMSSLGGDILDRDDVPSHIQEQVELLVGEESGFHDLGELVEAIESREIGKAMRRARGNKTRAAELLGISRFALQRKMDKYKIEVEIED